MLFWAKKLQLWRKWLLIALLGFASGLPLALTGSTLQAWATEQGLSLMAIGALSFVGQAYAFKLLWAPVVDRAPFLIFRGLRRSWLIGCQCGIALGLALMAICHLPEQFTLLVFFAIIIAIFSATFDTVFDAFRIEYLAKQEYGLGNAVYITAYRIAMLVSGGLAMVAAAYFSWRVVYLFMALLALLGAWVSGFVPESSGANNKLKSSFARLAELWAEVPRHSLRGVITSLYTLAERFIPRFVWVMAFIVLYKFGEAFGTALSTSFLLRVGHFSLTQIGFTYKTCGLLATISGGFIGAIAYRYIRLKYLLIIFGLCQALSMAWYIPIALGQHSLVLMMTAVIFEAGCAGMATTVFVCFLMRLCTSTYVASQFALLAAAAAIGRIVTGPMAAGLIERIGWVDYFYVSMLICLPALLIIPILWRHPVFEEKSGV